MNRPYQKIVATFMTLALLLTMLPNSVLALKSGKTADLHKQAFINAARSKRQKQLSLSQDSNPLPDADSLVRVIVQTRQKPRIQGGNPDFEDLKSQINKLSNRVKYHQNFNYLVSGFSLDIEQKYLDQLRSIKGVVSVRPARRYKPMMTNAVAITNINQVWEEKQYRGEGMVVAIIDTGIDVEHKDMRLSNPAKAKIQDIKQSTDTHFTAKVPWGHNYADGTDIVKDLDTKSMHGMHVAGIVAANATDADYQSGHGIRGVAPEAQLLAMKVFSNNEGVDSSYEDAIVKAIEDSVKHGADVINMSLGADNGFADPEEAEIMAIKEAREQGVICVVAAGNASTSTTDSDDSIIPKNVAHRIENATVGSPATAPDALTVAASNNNVPNSYFSTLIATGDTEEEFKHRLGRSIYDFAALDKTVAWEVVDVNLGTIDDYKQADGTELDLTGKIAFIRRGDITFSEKLTRALDHHAVMAIVANNKDEPAFGMAGVENIDLPSITVSQEVGDKIQTTTVEGGRIKLSLRPDTSEFGLVASFTSFGPTPELDFKPEVMAPGANIYSTLNNNSYGSQSGTSMATPHVAGTVALMLGALQNETFPIDKIDFVRLSLTNTADPQIDKPAQTNKEITPRRQGAGLIQVDQAIKNRVLITEENHKAVKALKEVDGQTEFNLTLTNYGTTDQAYEVKLSDVLTEETDTDDFLKDVTMAGATIKVDLAAGSNNSDTSSNAVVSDISTAPSQVGGETGSVPVKPAMTINNQGLVLGGGVGAPDADVKTLDNKVEPALAGSEPVSLDLAEPAPTQSESAPTQSESAPTQSESAPTQSESAPTQSAASVSEISAASNQKSAAKLNLETNKPLDTQVPPLSTNVSTPKGLGRANSNPTGVTITVPAGGKTTLTVSIDLSQAPTEQFVEGYIYFNAKNPDTPSLSFPYMGFNGDFGKEPIFDKPKSDPDSVYDVLGLMSENQYLGSTFDMMTFQELVDQSKVAFSPNDDGNYDDVALVLGLLRNVKELVVDVVKEPTPTAEPLVVIAKDKNIRKPLHQKGGPANYLAGWDGTRFNPTSGEYEVVPDGQYYIRLTGNAYTKHDTKQYVYLPLIVDTQEPTIEVLSSGFEGENYIVKFKAVDNENGIGLPEDGVGVILDGADKEDIYDNDDGAVDNIYVYSIPKEQVDDGQNHTLTLGALDIVYNVTTKVLSINDQGVSFFNLPDTDELIGATNKFLNDDHTSYELHGAVGADVKRLVINGQEAEIADGSFSIELPVAEGENPVIWEAFDASGTKLAGSDSNQPPVIHLDTVPPVLNLTSHNIDEVYTLTANTVTVKGIATDNSNLPVRISIGSQVPVEFASGAEFSGDAKVDWTRMVRVRAIDAAGNETVQEFQVIFEDDDEEFQLFTRGLDSFEFFGAESGFVVDGNLVIEGHVNKRVKTLLIGDVEVPVKDDLTFSHTYKLQEVFNHIGVKVIGLDGSLIFQKGITVYYDKTLPKLSLNIQAGEEPNADGVIEKVIYTNSDTYEVSGTASDNGLGYVLLLNGNEVLKTDITSDKGAAVNERSFTSQVPSAEGDKLLIEIIDSFGNNFAETYRFVHDAEKPIVTMQNPLINGTLYIPATLQFGVNEEATLEISLNGEVYNGETVTAPGSNVVIVKATDRAGNVSETRFEFTTAARPAASESSDDTTTGSSYSYSLVPGTVVSSLILGPDGRLHMVDPNKQSQTGDKNQDQGQGLGADPVPQTGEANHDQIVLLSLGLGLAILMASRKRWSRLWRDIE